MPSAQKASPPAKPMASPRAVSRMLRLQHGIGEFGVGMAYGVVLAGGIAGVLGAGALLVSRSVRRNAPGGWGAALSDLKAAVVIAQKGGVRG